MCPRRPQAACTAASPPCEATLCSPRPASLQGPYHSLGQISPLVDGLVRFHLLDESDDLRPQGLRGRLEDWVLGQF